MRYNQVMAKIKNYRERLLTKLKDPKEAAEYLNAAIQDADPRVFLLALQDIAEALGGMKWLAEHANLNRENLYRSLSMKGNPRFFTLLSILRACEVSISIQAKPKTRKAK